MPKTTEEIERLQVERVQLQSTIQRVLDFPKRIEYKCMVPVSKVGFMPGKIVHTNEFLLVPDSECSIIKEVSPYPLNDKSSAKWHSYTETAEVLMNRVADIDRDLGASKITGSKKQMMFPSVSSSDRVSKEPKVINERKNPSSCPVTAKEQIHLSSGTHIENEDKNVDVDYSQQNGIEGVFEIREFIDSDGKEIKNEIVNLQEEMNEMEKKIGSLVAYDEKSTLPVSSSDKEKIQNSASFINQLSSDIKEKTLKRPDTQHNESNYTEKYETDLEVLDRLDDLEREEEEWLAESEAADRIRQREKEFQAKALPEASLGGWKKGFFSKSASQCAKPESSNAVLTPSRGSAVLKSPSPVGEANGKLKISQSRGMLEKKSPAIPEGKSDVGKKAVSFQQTPSLVQENRTAVKPAVMSKAFTGSVMERFP
jgi:prefoldin subunit 5